MERWSKVVAMNGEDWVPRREADALADAADIYAVAIEAGISDGRDADAASLQAAFWRARAIELGASETEYRDRYQ